MGTRFKFHGFSNFEKLVIDLKKDIYFTPDHHSYTHTLTETGLIFLFSLHQNPKTASPNDAKQFKDFPLNVCTSVYAEAHFFFK